MPGIHRQRRHLQSRSTILGPAEGEDINAVTKLHGHNIRLDEPTRDMINELWHTVCDLIDQITAPIVAATAHDLLPVLDRATAEDPF